MKIGKHMEKVLILFCFFFLVYSFIFAQEEIDDDRIRELLSEAHIISGDFEKAEKFYKEIIKKDPSNWKMKASLADVFAYTKRFTQAIALYEEILEQTDDINIKKKLADVLSWAKRYEEAITLYDEILREEDDRKVRLQKARVLGWMRDYKKAVAQYRKILDAQYDPLIETEMKTKKAYWNNRVKEAIAGYSKLIGKEPKNTEAMFDLSQVYSYQSMFKEAKAEFERILNISPNHFRAKDGLEKAGLIADHWFIKTGYEFFEADSTGRDWDLKRHSFFTRLGCPVNYKFKMEADYKLTERSFSDFSDVTENEGKLNFTYINNPDWQIGAFYDFILYNKDIDTLHTFGTNINIRVFDMGKLNLSYERQQLENNSSVIRGHFYRDNYEQCLYLDISKRLKIGTDYLYAYYSDSNYKHEPGVDVLYCFSLEPRKFSIKYRYFYRNFRYKRDDYFTPKGFSTNSLSVDWKHYLNKEEIFFGADDLYYGLGYEASVDSKDIVGHKFKAEFNWDINKRLNFNLKGSIVNSSANVYKDKNVVVSIKYYF
ncbi:MAG: tetratricopeptide repeat protein [Candidatus Omnitrophota bacterium]|nr:MAG: tetratricopeptide repeat protein [Candidatus Omnitrophota bacterium]